MNWELSDTVAFISFTLILYFLSNLSKRLGEVMGLKKYYYFYYAGMVFTLSGSFIVALYTEDFENPLLLGYALFGLGLTFGLFASIKYWGWLIKELFKG